MRSYEEIHAERHPKSQALTKKPASKCSSGCTFSHFAYDDPKEIIPVRKIVEKKEKSTAGQYVGKPILQYTLDGKFVKRWSSIKVAAQCLGLCETSISKVCRRIKHQTGGWIFDYEDTFG